MQELWAQPMIKSVIFKIFNFEIILFMKTHPSKSLKALVAKMPQSNTVD